MFPLRRPCRLAPLIYRIDSPVPIRRVFHGRIGRELKVSSPRSCTSRSMAYDLRINTFARSGLQHRIERPFERSVTYERQERFSSRPTTRTSAMPHWSTPRRLARESDATLLIAHVEEPPIAYGGGEMYYGIPDPDRDEVQRMLAAVKPTDPSVPVQLSPAQRRPGHGDRAIGRRRERRHDRHGDARSHGHRSDADGKRRRVRGSPCRSARC